jgi:hypothetical protein
MRAVVAACAAACSGEDAFEVVGDEEWLEPSVATAIESAARVDE